MTTNPSSSSQSNTSLWHQIWQDAQPRIAQIRSSLLSSVAPFPRVTRVGQVDAELLDQELVQVLKEPLVKALAHINSTWRSAYEPELTLFIGLVLYKFSIWNHGASFGAKLQGLKYDVTKVPEKYRRVAACGLPHRTLLAHGLLTLLVPYIYTCIRSHALSDAWPDAPSSDRRRKAWVVLTRLESVHDLAGLLNFIAFLWDGRYRTSVDRLLGMKLVSARRLARRDVSYEFMNRQMVWHAFTEFLLFLLPMINTRTLRRRLVMTLSQFTLTLVFILPASAQSLFTSPPGAAEAATSKQKGKYYNLSADQCAICAENASPNLINSTQEMHSFADVASAAFNTSPAADDDPVSGDEPPAYPINTPYITSCGHVYCYYCLADRMMRTADDRTGVGPGGTQWECLRCNEGVASVDRAEAQVEGPEYESGVEDELEYEYNSEDLEFTDISGSIGSYSESGLSE